MSLRVILGFNVAERFKWQGGVWAVACVRVCVYGRICASMCAGKFIHLCFLRFESGAKATGILETE